MIAHCKEKKRKQLAVSNESEAEFFTTEGTEDTDEQSGHIYPKVCATRAR
jgi:hypothetical protein